MPTKPDKLLPCPFCGGQPVHGYQGDEDGGYGYCECNCPKLTTDSPSVFAGVHAETEAEAMRRWNMRG